MGNLCGGEVCNETAAPQGVKTKKAAYSQKGPFCLWTEAADFVSSLSFIKEHSVEKCGLVLFQDGATDEAGETCKKISLLYSLSEGAFSSLLRMTRAHLAAEDK